MNQQATQIRTADLDFFEVPRHLLAREPREVRGEQRHDSRLIVMDRSAQSIQHSTVREIGSFLQRGDVIVLNNSLTIPSVLRARKEDGRLTNLYLCSDRGGGAWHVQIEPSIGVKDGFKLSVDGDSLGGFTGEVVGAVDNVPGLYVMQLTVHGDLGEILQAHAKPVYSTYTRQQWDIKHYQNFYATVPGSVELPSAGRHFSPQLLDSLMAQGIAVAYVTLHTGMSNLTIQEENLDEHKMYDEFFTIDAETAALINDSRSSGGRTVGIGTTVMRSLESVTDKSRTVQAYSGWTDLFISPGYEFNSIDVFQTNFHGPRTTRLALAMAFSGQDLLKRAYLEAIEREYLFYEFGDTTLTI